MFDIETYLFKAVCTLWFRQVLQMGCYRTAHMFVYASVPDFAYEDFLLALAALPFPSVAYPFKAHDRGDVFVTLVLPNQGAFSWN